MFYTSIPVAPVKYQVWLNLDVALARLMAKSQKTREKVWKAQSLLWHNLSPIVVLALLVVEFYSARHNIFGGTISVVALAGPADLCSRDLTWERATRGRARTIRLGIRGPDYSEYGASTSLGPNYTSDESDYSRPGLVGHSQTHFGRWTLIRSFTAFHTRRQNIIYRPAASVQWCQHLDTRQRTTKDY